MYSSEDETLECLLLHKHVQQQNSRHSMYNRHIADDLHLDLFRLNYLFMAFSALVCREMWVFPKWDAGFQYRVLLLKLKLKDSNTNTDCIVKPLLLLVTEQMPKKESLGWSKIVIKAGMDRK
jgi:hypothetical protein